MGKASRDKGYRVEAALVRFLRTRGFKAERVPLSGAAGGSHTGDVTIELAGLRRLEVKSRKDGFAQLYRWLGGNDFLVVKADRKESLIVMKVGDALDMADALRKEGPK